MACRKYGIQKLQDYLSICGRFPSPSLNNGQSRMAFRVEVIEPRSACLGLSQYFTYYILT